MTTNGGYGQGGYGEGGYGGNTARIAIWHTGDAAYTDRTNWLFASGDSPDDPILSRKQDLNQPQTLTFNLSNGTPGLTAPVQGNRVSVALDTFPDFFTGYLTTTPELTVLGLKDGVPTYGYACTATDESQILEWKAAAIFPTLPPFLNQTQGVIIKALIRALGGTQFDVINVDDGVLVPYFRTSTSEGFWQAVRRLIDNAQAKFWIENGKCFFKNYNDVDFGYAANESLTAIFDPTDLTVTPVQNQIYNDVIGFGTVEPTAYCREYFVGDGLTASFTLKKPVFSSASSALLQDDWTEGQIDPKTWNLQPSFDIDNLLDGTNGSLKLFGGTSVNPARLTMNAGIEMSGSQVLRAGRFNFFKPTDAIIGALMNADTGSLSDVVFGFRATKSGFNTQLQAIVNGTPTGPTYITKPGMTYQLTVTVDAPQLVRTQQTFFSRLNSFGGDVVASGANASFLVEEVQNFGSWQADTAYALYTKIIDFNNRLEMVTTPGTSGDDVPDWPAIENQVTVDGDGPLAWTDLGLAPASGTTAPVDVLVFNASISTIGQWLYYMLLGGPYDNTSIDALLTCNYTYLHTPLYMELYTKIRGASMYTRQQLGDKTDLSARAGVVTNSGVTTVQFFQDVQPAIGEFVRIVYRAADVSRARIQRASSVTTESAKSGDDGIRSGVLPALQQQPRNSAEIELAIQAYIDDHTGSLFQGDWAFNSRNYTLGTNPVPGRFININSPSRYPQFDALVTSVQVDYMFRTPSGLDFINVDATFGPLYRFDEIQQQFNQPTNAAAGAADLTVSLDPIEFEDVGSAHADDRDSCDWDGVIGVSTYEIDAGAAPTDAYEVRKTDEGWGTAATVNLIETVPGETFTIPRNAVDSVIYLKNRDTEGAVSRYPAMVRIVLPLVPAAPTSTIDTTDPSNPIVTLGSDILLDPNVYGFEIRNGYGTVLFNFANLALQPSDLIWTLQNNTQTDFTLSIYTFNLLGEYSTPDVLDVGPLTFPNTNLPSGPPGPVDEFLWGKELYAVPFPTNPNSPITPPPEFGAFTDELIRTGNVQYVAAGTSAPATHVAVANLAYNGQLLSHFEAEMHADDSGNYRINAVVCPASKDPLSGLFTQSEIEYFDNAGSGIGYFFRARCVDIVGQLGPWSAWVTGTSAVIPPPETIQQAPGAAIGPAFWAIDPSIVLLRDDFVANGTLVGELDWVPTGLTAEAQSAHGLPALGVLHLKQAPNAPDVAGRLLFNGTTGDTSKNGWPILDYPGWKNIWVFSPCNNSIPYESNSATPLDFSKWKFYLGFEGQNQTSGGDNSRTRPFVFLGLRFDPDLGDSTYQFEYVVNSPDAASGTAPLNTQGPVVHDTGITPKEDAWYRLEITQVFGDNVTLTLREVYEGKGASSTFDMPIFKTQIERIKDGASGAHCQTIGLQDESISLRPSLDFTPAFNPWAGGSKITVSSFICDNFQEFLTGTAIARYCTKDLINLRWNGGERDLQQDYNCVLQGYPALQPCVLWGTISSIPGNHSVTVYMGLLLDLFGFEWNMAISDTTKVPDERLTRYYPSGDVSRWQDGTNVPSGELADYDGTDAFGTAGTYQFSHADVRNDQPGLITITDPNLALTDNMTGALIRMSNNDFGGTHFGSITCNGMARGPQNPASLTLSFDWEVVNGTDPDEAAYHTNSTIRLITAYCGTQGAVQLIDATSGELESGEFWTPGGPTGTQTVSLPLNTDLRALQLVIQVAIDPTIANTSPGLPGNPALTNTVYITVKNARVVVT